MDQKLETFLTLCKTMHYGRAAELLHLSQPAVSKHIQALEAQYGVRLFTYQARRLQKTREGDLLEQYAFSLRYNEEMLLARLHEKSKTLLRIGATKSIGDYILLPEIRRFLAKPDQQLHFLVDNTAHLLAKLEDGELDFVVLEGLFDKQRYDFFLLREEPYLGICAADHPFAGKQIPIPDLFSERLILREEGSGTRKIIERELTQSGYHVSAFSDCACISSFKLLKELVRENCGISFVYEAVVKDDPRFGRFFCPPAHRGARTECRLPQKYGRWALGASVSGKVTEKTENRHHHLFTGSPFTVCTRTLSNLAYFFTSFINASRSFTICSRFPVGPMKYSLPPISSGFPVVLVRTPNVSLLLSLR